MAQWVKNPTAAAQVAVEVQVQSLAQHSELKDLALPQFCGSCDSDSFPGPGTSIPWGQPLKKKNFTCFIGFF